VGGQPVDYRAHAGSCSSPAGRARDRAQNEWRRCQLKEFHVAVVPVGKVAPVEVEAALTRVAKILKRPFELRATLPVPQTGEDRERGQFRASKLMTALRSLVPQHGPGRLVGVDEGEPPLKPDAYLFVTDVDMFTANSDGASAALMSSKGLAVVSVRRLREAFHRRPADPVKQRTRLVKEIARMAGRLEGLHECGDPKCVFASSKVLADLDLKEERICRPCSLRLFEGSIRI
jgi:predicted Zn-dependent protease